MNRLVLFSFLFLLFPFSNVFGSPQTSIGDDIIVFVQSTVRNSDGTLIVYLESEKFTFVNFPALASFLDFEATRGNAPIITIDSNQYQIIRRAQSNLFDSDGVIASTILSDTVDGKSILLARFAHDGYPVIPGDTLESTWTFIRPVS